MALFFTADTHFGHAAILRHMPERGLVFRVIEDHDAGLIQRWNDTVGPKDEVWHLGDFAWGRKHAAKIRPQLNGSIHLVLGNHDDPKIARDGLFASVHEAHYLRHEGIRLYLSHYAHRVWRSSHHGSYHLFGHSHGHLASHGRSCDVGVDPWGGRPVSFDWINELLGGRPVVDHHGNDAGKEADPS